MLSRKHKRRSRNRKRTKTNMFADGHWLNDFYKAVNKTLKNEKKD